MSYMSGALLARKNRVACYSIGVSASRYSLNAAAFGEMVAMRTCDWNIMTAEDPRRSQQSYQQDPRHIDSLIDTVNDLSRQLDFSRFFERAASAAAATLEAEGAAFIVLDGPEYLLYRFFIGLPTEYEHRYRNHRFASHLGTSGTALRSGRPVFNPDYAASPDAMPEYVATGLRSNLVLPVFSGEIPVGVLAISWFTCTAPDHLDPGRIAVANMMANLIGSAYHRLSLEEELRCQAHYDLLTGLPNRVLLFERFEQALYQARAAERLIGILVLDLDGFKQVNDRMGHQVGDRLLRDIAQRLRDVVRRADLVARLGGDEFVLLLENISRIDEIENIVRRVLTATNTAVNGNGMTQQVSTSIGITIFPFDDAAPETLLSHADAAMYEIKKQGGHHYCYFDAALQRQITNRRQLEQEARSGLVNGEFLLYYQPIVDGISNAAVGAEALLRWQHPQRGLLTPGFFLQCLERSSISNSLGDWVLEQAITQLSNWQACGLDLWLNVNVSGTQLESGNFALRLRELLRKHPACDPSSLKLEIIESVAINDFDKMAELCVELKEMGIRFVLDDFGTGYASIAYLRKLEVQAIKIDRSFVAALEQPSERVLVDSLIGLARNLDLDCVAEGVETYAQQQSLLASGCRLLQGFGIARPMPAADLPRWLAAR